MNDFFEGGDLVAEYYQDKIEDVIERLEAYPTCMSCYLKQEESVAASQLKWKFIEILKEELLDEDS